MKLRKIVVMGSGGVGKSALCVQFVSGHFVEEYDPTLEDYYRKQVDINGTPAVLEIIDTAGIEQFAAMRDLYIENGEGFMLVYSITNAQTFIDMQPLRGEIARVKGGFSSPIMLVGNKFDMEEERSVTTQDGEKLAEEWGCQFYETSAKARCNVQEVFKGLAQVIKPVEKNSGCCVCL